MIKAVRWGESENCPDPILSKLYVTGFWRNSGRPLKWRRSNGNVRNRPGITNWISVDESTRSAIGVKMSEPISSSTGANSLFLAFRSSMREKTVFNWLTISSASFTRVNDLCFSPSSARIDTWSPVDLRERYKTSLLVDGWLDLLALLTESSSNAAPGLLNFSSSIGTLCLISLNLYVYFHCGWRRTKGSFMPSTSR